MTLRILAVATLLLVAAVGCGPSSEPQVLNPERAPDPSLPADYDPGSQISTIESLTPTP